MAAEKVRSGGAGVGQGTLTASAAHLLAEVEGEHKPNHLAVADVQVRVGTASSTVLACCAAPVEQHPPARPLARLTDRWCNAACALSRVGSALCQPCTRTKPEHCGAGL